VNLHPGAFVSLLTVPGITKGVVLRADGHLVRVRWITRPFMEGKESTHREEDLYKLAYRVSPSPDRDHGRNDEVRPFRLRRESYSQKQGCLSVSPSRSSSTITASTARTR
jgi:hypothetical protein